MKNPNNIKVGDIVTLPEVANGIFKVIKIVKNKKYNTIDAMLDIVLTSRYGKPKSNLTNRDYFDISCCKKLDKSKLRSVIRNIEDVLKIIP